MTRRDRLGRRIGSNWWREYIMAAYRAAWHHRDELAEQNHQLEAWELPPKPQLKAFLLAEKGRRAN